jgi:coproporphyrinogen III oxidase-like Fe-S oxidoreductase
MISAQHVHDCFNNLNTKQQRGELEKTKKVDPTKLAFFKLMREHNKKLMPILASTSSKEDTHAKKLEQKTDASMSKQNYVASNLNAHERV